MKILNSKKGIKCSQLMRLETLNSGTKKKSIKKIKIKSNNRDRKNNIFINSL